MCNCSILRETNALALQPSSYPLTLTSSHRNAVLFNMGCEFNMGKCSFLLNLVMKMSLNITKPKTIKCSTGFKFCYG